MVERFEGSHLAPHEVASCLRELYLSEKGRRIDATAVCDGDCIVSAIEAFEYRLGLLDKTGRRSAYLVLLNIGRDRNDVDSGAAPLWPWKWFSWHLCTLSFKHVS